MGTRKKAVNKATPKKAAPTKAAPKKAAPKQKASKQAAPKKVAPKKPAARGAAPNSGRQRKLEAIRQAAARAQPEEGKLEEGKPRGGKPRGGKLEAVGAPQPKRGKKAAASSKKRNFGLRGAAPWVARHAAKHAAELRRRNAEPPPPGSARATLRTPEQAAQIKSTVTELHGRSSKVNSLRNKLDQSFFDIGELLQEIQQGQLYEAKGYSSFEAFVDREIDLPRNTALRLIRIVQTFQRDAAYDFPLDLLMTALSALDGEVMTAPPSHPSSRGFSSTTLPPHRPLRWDE